MRLVWRGILPDVDRPEALVLLAALLWQCHRLAENRASPTDVAPCPSPDVRRQVAQIRRHVALAPTRVDGLRGGPPVVQIKAVVRQHSPALLAEQIARASTAVETLDIARFLRHF